MQKFKDYLDKIGIDYFIIEMPKNLIFKEALVNESQWVETGRKNWMVRVDAEIPELKQMQHVHIARTQYIKSKNKQVAWNKDGTKHDKKSFNSKIGSIKLVQKIARDVLALDQNIKLEKINLSQKIVTKLNESINIDFQYIVFKLKIN